MHRFRRADALRRLAEEHFDLLVVGGGVTGAGVALDAASRGLKTALVEQADFASGTSSRSSKLVHGGLRYLSRREFGLVHESLLERQRLLDNAPHLVNPLPFLIPLLGGQSAAARVAAARSYAAALWLYDLAGGLRIGARHHRLTRAQALAHLPALRPDLLAAGFLYFDAGADDARLTLALARTAALEHGAVVANYLPAVRLTVGDGGNLTGAVVRPDAADPAGEFDIRARVVVNATGVWSDDTRALDEGAHPRAIRPAKGVHLTVPAPRLPCNVAVVLPVRGDHRSVFVVPWPDDDLVYIGTTDTPYEGPLDAPACTPQDVDYLLAAVNAATTSALTRADVTAVWAGLRPLLRPPQGATTVSARTADLSRRHTVRVSAHGMVSVTGGKLTTYRRMAEDTVDAVLRRLGESPRTRRCRTGTLPVLGATRATRDPVTMAGPHAHLLGRYGTETGAVLALAQGRPELLERVVPGLPYIGAEIVFAAREEMAHSLDDVLSRRTRARIQRTREAIDAAPAVARLLGHELGWDAKHTVDEADRFVAACQLELRRAGLDPA